MSDLIVSVAVQCIEYEAVRISVSFSPSLSVGKDLVAFGARIREEPAKRRAMKIGTGEAQPRIRQGNMDKLQ